MTRQEFLENVTTFGELKDFCYDQDCDLLEDVYDEDSMNEDINEHLVDWAYNDTWQELYSRLEDIPTGYDWYRNDDYDGWIGLDDSDFDQYKQDVLDWMDVNGYWEDDEDDEGDGDDVFAEELARDAAARERDEEGEIEDEDFSVGDLIGMCGVAFVAIQKESVRRLQEADRQFGDFVDVNVPKTIK